MCHKEDDKKNEFKELLDSIGQEPTSKMRDVKEGFSVDLQNDDTEKNNNK